MTRIIRQVPVLRWAFVAACLLAAAVSLPAQPATPLADYTDDTTPLAGPRGERIRQLLAILDSGGPARAAAFAGEAFAGRFAEIPVERHIDAFLRFHDGSRGLEFHGVRRYPGEASPDRVVVIARNRLTGGWQGITVTFDGTGAHRITGLSFQPARPPKDLPPQPPLTTEQARAELASFLDRLAAAEVFSGTALLARKGEVVFEGARGVADRNHDVPMRLDSKLNLGSMNKMYPDTGWTRRAVEHGRRHEPGGAEAARGGRSDSLREESADEPAKRRSRGRSLGPASPPRGLGLYSCARP